MQILTHGSLPSGRSGGQAEDVRLPRLATNLERHADLADPTKRGDDLLDGIGTWTVRREEIEDGSTIGRVEEHGKKEPELRIDDRTPSLLDSLGASGFGKRGGERRGCIRIALTEHLEPARHDSSIGDTSRSAKNAEAGEQVLTRQKGRDSTLTTLIARRHEKACQLFDA